MIDGCLFHMPFSSKQRHGVNWGDQSASSHAFIAASDLGAENRFGVLLYTVAFLEQIGAALPSPDSQTADGMSPQKSIKTRDQQRSVRFRKVKKYPSGCSEQLCFLTLSNFSAPSDRFSIAL
jgi:hypothetical protein